MSVVIEFAKPADYLNMNDRKHWRTAAKLKKAWREAAFWASVKCEAQRTYQPMSLVTISLPVRSVKQRRDAHNWYPTFKSVIDGLVDAYVFEDDSTNHLRTSEPSFHQGGNTVIVTITEMI